MSRIGTITRRAFLVGSVAIAGGVAFGTYLYRKPAANPLLDDLAEGEAALTPWVLIDAEKITLITPHSDLGQGAVSMQAMLLAEELDLEFGQFETSPGVPSPAYYNTAMATELAPFNAHDTSVQARAVRGGLGVLGKFIGLQGTGGSSSVPDSFEKLRTAGAVARETLKRAASERSGINTTALRTEAGKVILPDGTAFTYQELAADTAGLAPVRKVRLREPSEWRLIGKEVQRLDILAKSTGTQAYGIDLEVEGMVHAAVKVNPRQGGALNGYDASAALEMRGVSRVVEVTGGAAVIADNTWRAFHAAEAIDFDWGPAPYPAEMEGHWAEVAASFTEERLDKEWRHDGDVDAAVSEGQAVESEYRAPYVAHAPLEPLNALALFEAGRLDLWAAHQMPRFLQQIAARVAGIDIGQVHFHQQYAGGSFGHRLEFENVRQAVEIAIQMPGTPVKLTYSREEDFAHDFPRQIGMARGVGTVKDGRVESYDLQVATVSSSASQTARMGQPVFGPDGQIAAGAWNQPFAVPNFRVRAYRVPELAPTSSWRSVGASTQGFFASAFLDELIHAAGADPLAERLRLCTHDVSRKVLEAVGEISDWGSSLGEGRGRGLAFVDSFGVPVAEVVEVTETEDGIRIDKVFVAADVGTIVDPVNFDNHVKGAVVWGLGHAMNCEITYSDGMVEQANYFDHEGMRMHQCPEIFVKGLETAPKVRGIGEPPVPPAAPALAAAIFDATGTRLREMPFNRFVDFV
ncbi:molybdopterin cofactor-binding domain-containing protein [Tropicimonas sp. TH_r6]|uniref:xanthine dehydrogenase family protein molybdopterin-binding subunit n=1 Tax=Tropicimonas sp. TH_r6 TaxID=3082085 RepID=UPI00295400A0|nr:molybdopterin cofactor-binding domain-containing protein [Tropicimonas sp. TH_r6]MDV7141330.1 molybdopterin cofactor-binding domain-containing protein [Tropicimonas sp. TH_r6]